MYECYIAAARGSHVDVGNDENDRKLTEKYARSKAQITLVTFHHKRVFQTNTLVRTWYKPRVLLCFLVLLTRYWGIIITVPGCPRVNRPGIITWGGRILTLHLNYVAGYTGPLLFLFE